MREIYPEIWIKNLLMVEQIDILVVSDLRFPNEANAILEDGGLVYRIDRASQPKVSDGADDPLESFTQWSGVITNDGSIQDFYSKLDEIQYG